MSGDRLSHVEPFAAGGAATVENIELRCRPHNAHEARLFFGGNFVRERRDSFWNERPRSPAMSDYLRPALSLWPTRI